MFGFRTRNKTRDRETDVSRQRRLVRLLDDIIAEIRSEGEGLEARYRLQTEQAAFLADALANERTASTEWDRVDRLTTSIIAYDARRKALSRQLYLIEECRRKVNDFTSQLEVTR